MDEQKSFPTAMLGFSKGAVLDYIYEADAAHKEAEESLRKENDALTDENRQLKAALEEAAARIEEANSQYGIIKAQLYNAKEDARKALEASEKVRQDAVKLGEAASNKDKELQIQLELNKKFQARCANLQSALDELTEKVQKTAATAKAQAQSEADQEIGAIRGEMQSLRAAVAKKLNELDTAISKMSGQKTQAAPSTSESNRFFQ